MILKMRPHLFYVKTAQIPMPIHKNNRMGIPHGNTCHFVLFSFYLNPLRYGLLLPGNHRDILCPKHRRTHIHLYACHLAVLHRKLQYFHIPAAYNPNALFIRQPLIIYIFSHTPDAVPAHFRPGTVRVIHFHLKIRLLPCALTG